MGDLDIYGDLEIFDAQIELDQRKQDLEVAKSKWKGLSEQLEKLLDKNRKLEEALSANKYNFRTVLQTVRLEVRRKDSQIEDLKMEKQFISQNRIKRKEIRATAATSATTTDEAQKPKVKMKKRFTNTLPLEELVGRKLPELLPIKHERRETRKRDREIDRDRGIVEEDGNKEKHIKSNGSRQIDNVCSERSSHRGQRNGSRPDDSRDYRKAKDVYDEGRRDRSKSIENRHHSRGDRRAEERRPRFRSPRRSRSPRGSHSRRGMDR